MSKLPNRDKILFLFNFKERFVFICTGGAGSSGADGTCLVDDLECNEMHDRLGMEAIKSLHEQLDDDDNGNIDLTESDDVST